MYTKLTLRLEDTVIQEAKECARRVGKSVSQMVEEYFTLLKTIGRSQTEEELPPTVKHLKGLLRGANVSEEDYYRYLEEKHR
jgi:hypothetical protein